jgi:DNA-binding NtrC family response regulator
MMQHSVRAEMVNRVSAILARIEARPPDYIPTLAEMEKLHILRTVRIKQGRVDLAAAALGIVPKTVTSRIKRYASEEGVV